MTYRVVLQAQADRDLGEAYRRAAAHAPDDAARWLARFEEAIATLAHNPTRCPTARENGKVDVELREFLFGRRPYVFRVIFTVEVDTVRIFRIIRAQRRFLTRKQIEDAVKGDDWPPNRGPSVTPP